MLKIRLMKTSPLAIAISPAFLLGGAAQAQQPAPTAGTGSTGATTSPGMSGSGKAMPAPGGIAGTTNPQDNIANPAPMAGKAKSPEMRDEKAAKKAAEKGNKKPTRNKGMSNSSTNDTGTTTAPGTK